MKKDFIFPPSVQSDLFNYLKPQQQEILRPILRIMKRPYQAKLCTALLDYLEGNGTQPIDDLMLDKLQHQIIEIAELHPLRNLSLNGLNSSNGLRGNNPQPIGQIIKSIFGKGFNN